MRRIAIAAVVTLVSSLATLTAYAQTTDFGRPLGWIFVSDDNTAYSPCISSPSFVPFTVYLMASLSYSHIDRPELDASTGMQAWEAGIDIPGLGGDIVIQNADFRNGSLPGGWSDPTNVITGLSPAILATDTPTDLVEYTLLLLADGLEDVIITIGPSNPSSFSPAGPGFAESADVGECTHLVTGEGIECKRAFDRISYGVINAVHEGPCYVHAAETKSWSAIKAQY